MDVGGYGLPAKLDDKADFTYSHGPTQRFVIDMDPRGPVARNALPGGNVWDSQDPHFRDEAERWRRNQNRPVPFAIADVIDAAETRVVYEHPVAARCHAEERMIELVVLGATLAIAAGASGAQARRRTLAARTLERYAKWRSHLYVPGAQRKESPRVEGTKDEVAFTIDLVKIRGNLKTRVRAPVSKGPGAKLAIVQRGTIRPRAPHARRGRRRGRHRGLRPRLPRPRHGTRRGSRLARGLDGEPRRASTSGTTCGSAATARR